MPVKTDASEMITCVVGGPIRNELKAEIKEKMKNGTTTT